VVNQVSIACHGSHGGKRLIGDLYGRKMVLHGGIVAALGSLQRRWHSSVRV